MGQKGMRKLKIDKRQTRETVKNRKKINFDSSESLRGTKNKETEREQEENKSQKMLQNERKWEKRGSGSNRQLQLQVIKH